MAIACACCRIASSCSSDTFSAFSLEAHLNLRADPHLKGSDWIAFERMNILAKWLFLPRILGLPGLDSGKEPYQSFFLLVRARNGLAHYKAQRRPWTFRVEEPEEFAKKLLLTMSD